MRQPWSDKSNFADLNARGSVNAMALYACTLCDAQRPLGDYATRRGCTHEHDHDLALVRVEGLGANVSQTAGRVRG
jgi:hypothetical protein